LTRWGQHLRSRLAAGFFVVLPAAITIWLIVGIFHWSDEAFTQQALLLLGLEGAPGPLIAWAARVGAFLTVVMILYVAGLLATNVVGRRFLGASDRLIGRTPAVGRVYSGARQLFDAFGQGRGGPFRRCVLVEYPRRGLFRVGFVSSERPQSLGDPPRDYVAVFIPSTPNPVSGFLALIPAEECHALAVRTEEAIKMIVSGGIVTPTLSTKSGGGQVPPGGIPREAPR
jgi:uncharacterized membrane protein